MTTVYLNGEFVPKARATISVDDRGFVFGDGIYEVARVVDGRIFEWPSHAARMARGLAGIRIPLEASAIDALKGVCDRLVADNGLAEGEATVYLQVTRERRPARIIFLRRTRGRRSTRRRRGSWCRATSASRA